MKVIIDLIEDIRTAINNDKSFTLGTMGLIEQDNGEFTPSWQSDISRMQVDEKEEKLFLFLGKGEALDIGSFLKALNALSNEAMMYEVCVSYTKEKERVNSPLIGFGESFKDKKYLLFITDINSD
jgi:hypothetical protein